MTKAEEVKLALCAVDIQTDPATYWDRLARAAIEALREPTAEMIIAGASAKPLANRMNTLTAAGVYTAMIDAILSEGE